MNRKVTLVLVFILSGLTAFCSSSDSLKTKKVTNHFQLLLGNYAGESFISPNVNRLKPYYAPPGQINYVNYGKDAMATFVGKPGFTPLYSYSVGFNYAAGLSKHIGLRTGINYFTYGYTVKGVIDACPYCLDDANNNDNYRRVVFVSSLHIPLHLQVFQNCKRGKFVFSMGPDMLLPINTFGKVTTTSVYNSSSSLTQQIHYHVSAINFLHGGSMGYSAGLGFEKTLSKKLMIELLPEFSLLNAVPFDFEGQGKGIYQNYIFNTAFGLSTYLTFMK